MNQYQRIEKINQCLREFALPALPAVGTAVGTAAKNPFLQQLLLSLGINMATDLFSKKEGSDKPLTRGASVSLQQSGSETTSAKGSRPPTDFDPGKRTFATIRGKQLFPGRR